jgi:peroxiredoxin family protein
MNDGQPPLDKLSIIIYSGYYDKIHYALVMAAAAAAIGRPVTLFFTMGACHALKPSDSNGNPAWRVLSLSEEHNSDIAAFGGDRDDHYATQNVATFDDLLQSCIQLGVTFMVCEMGLEAEGLREVTLRADIPFQKGGVVTFLNDTSKDGTVIFI